MLDGAILQKLFNGLIKSRKRALFIWMETDHHIQLIIGPTYNQLLPEVLFFYLILGKIFVDKNLIYAFGK